MRRPFAARPLLAGLALAMALSGCASDGEPQRVTREVAARIFPGVRASLVPTPRYVALEQAGRPAMTVLDEQSSTRSVLRRLSLSQDGLETWLAPDGASFAFRSGVLVATRGAGDTLMAADVSELLSMLSRQAGGTAKRFHTALKGNNALDTTSYVCTVSFQATEGGRQAIEDCTGVDVAFTNTYRMAPTGAVLASRQVPVPGGSHFSFGGAGQ